MQVLRKFILRWLRVSLACYSSLYSNFIKLLLSLGFHLPSTFHIQKGITSLHVDSLRSYMHAVHTYFYSCESLSPGSCSEKPQRECCWQEAAALHLSIKVTKNIMWLSSASSCFELSPHSAPNVLISVCSIRFYTFYI